MVIYKCETCNKMFPHKTQYTRHINKTLPCKPGNNDAKQPKIHKCITCDKNFNRKDHYRKHVCKPVENNLNVNGNNANINIAGNDINNVNNIYIKQYNLVAFAKESKDCLTIDEQMSLFEADSPLSAAIDLINFDKNKLDNHNFFYDDLKSGSGMIYDGTTWRRENINTMIEETFDAKEQILINISNDLKRYATPETIKQIDIILEEVGRIIRPRGNNECEMDSKKLFCRRIKNEFFGNNETGKDAWRHTKNNLQHKHIKYNTRNVYRNCRLTSKEEKELMKNKITTAKQLREISARLLIFLLRKKQITAETKESITKFISETYEIKHLNAITNILSKANCFNNNIDINIDTLKNEIKRKDEEDLVVENIFKKIKPHLNNK